MDSVYILLIFSIISSTSLSDDQWNEQLDIEPNWITKEADKSVLEIMIDEDQNLTIPLQGAPFCRLWVTHKCDCYVLDQFEQSNWTMAFFSYCDGTIRGSFTNERDSFKIFPKNFPENDATLSNFQHNMKKIPLTHEHTKISSLGNDTLPWPGGTDDHVIESKPSLRRPELDPFNDMEYIKVFFAVDKKISDRHENLDYYLQSLVSVASQYYQNSGYVLVYQGWKTAKSTGWDAVVPYISGYDYSYYQEGGEDSDIIVLFLDVSQNERGTGGGAIGMAIFDSACSVRRGIYVYNSETREIITAITLTHEIGHTLGLRHTTETDCASRCLGGSENPEPKQCIMNPMVGSPLMPFDFSVCSKNYLSEKKSTHFCFRKKIKSPKPICGDGLVDADEECDCIQQECKACCRDCKLMEGKKCANGQCCDLTTCQLKTGSVCRPTRNYCDFEEKCDGQSSECPTDYVVADGYPCQQGQQGGYCYDGVCGSRNDMCQWMFTKSSAGDMKCYDKNMEGSSFAACGPEFNVEWWDKTVKCEKANTYCGKIFCKVPSEGKVMATAAFSRIRPLFKYSSERDCLSLSYSEKFGFYYYYLPRDISYVADGSWCGDGKMCLNQSCVPLPEGCPHNCPGLPMNDTNHPEVRPGVVYQEHNRKFQFRKPLGVRDFIFRRYYEVLPTVILIVIIIDLIIVVCYYFLSPYFCTQRLPPRTVIPMESFYRQPSEADISRDFLHQSPPTAWHLDRN